MAKEAKTDETAPEVTISIGDLNIAVAALQIANRRGAFELKESANVAGAVLRLEEFCKAHGSLPDTSKADTETTEDKA
jgi:hypothetical protein|tara:strand:+ start:403 stop:636 length:234 start_codon:yes stop_codon:yes gene_type:complete